MVKLIFIGEQFAGRVYELAVERTTVGRGDHNTLTIHDRSVTQSHCEILVFGSEVIVRDLGSSNGTFVNGERLHHQQRPVSAGQIVKFGSVEARLELDASSSSDTSTDITAFHAYARHMQEQPQPRQPAIISMTLETSPVTAPADHTVLLPRPHQAKETIAPPELEKARVPVKPASRTATALIGAALALGLAVLLWAIWGRG